MKYCTEFRMGHSVVLSIALLMLIIGLKPVTAAETIAVVAAENVYGGIVRQIGGDRVTVTSIISTLTQDPHLFEPAPSAARQLADAQIAVFNGANYDPWFETLLKAAPRQGRIAINVGMLRGVKLGDNPHLWYDPATMPEVAKALAEALTKADPAHSDDYRTRLNTTLASLAHVTQRVAQMKAKHGGTPVTATEAAFIPMANAMGLIMRDIGFQQEIANDAEPSAREIAAIENDLKSHKVKVLIYNEQVGGRLIERLRSIAIMSAVAVIGITETCPADRSFEDWMIGQLDALDKALTKSKS